jgi:hypothetical protein
MVLLEWETGDVITKRSANNKGVRKGTEAEIAAIASADRENGDHFWNSTNGFHGVPQIQMDATADDRSNIHHLIGADSTEVSIASATPTQVKDIDFVKNDDGFSCNQINIVTRIKQTGGGTTTATLYINGGTTGQSVTSTSATYEVKTIQYDASALAAGYHTLEIYLSNSTNTGDLQLLEIWGL